MKTEIIVVNDQKPQDFIDQIVEKIEETGCEVEVIDTTKQERCDEFKNVMVQMIGMIDPSFLKRRVYTNKTEKKGNLKNV